MMVLRWLSLVLLGASLQVFAQQPLDAKSEQQLRSLLEAGGGGLLVDTVAPSQVPGLYEVQFANGPLVYSTADGSFFIVGDLFATTADGYSNLSERKRGEERVAQVNAIDPADMIVFAAQGETRGTVTVFTDITCGYCQKLHREVPELNKRGIAVRYLAYPRGGLDSESYRQLATAWCAKDPRNTLTRMKNRERVPNKVCEENPVAEQYMLGQRFGIPGTPYIVLENGVSVPGYLPPAEIERRLGLVPGPV